MKVQQFITNSAEETEKLGREVATSLRPSDIILLTADLGGGKTTFTRGLVAGLGFSNRVISPTFTLQRTYEKKFKEQDSKRKITGPKIETIYHLDLYRLESLDNLHSLDFTDMFEDRDAITIIEWPELSESVVGNKNRKIRIQFEYLDDKKRKIMIMV